MFKLTTCDIHGFFQFKDCYICNKLMEEQQNGFNLICYEDTPTSSELLKRKEFGPDGLERDSRHIIKRLKALRDRTEMDDEFRIIGHHGWPTFSRSTAPELFEDAIAYLGTLSPDNRRSSSPSTSPALDGFGSIDMPVLNRKQCGRCSVLDKLERHFTGAPLCHFVYSDGENRQYPESYNRIMEVLQRHIPAQGKSKNWILAVHDIKSIKGSDRSHIHALHQCLTYGGTHRTCRCAFGDRFTTSGFTVRKEYVLQPTKEYIGQVLLYLQVSSVNLIFS